MVRELIIYKRGRFQKTLHTPRADNSNVSFSLQILFFLSPLLRNAKIQKNI